MLLSAERTTDITADKIDIDIIGKRVRTTLRALTLTDQERDYLAFLNEDRKTPGQTNINFLKINPLQLVRRHDIEILAELQILTTPSAKIK